MSIYEIKDHYKSKSKIFYQKKQKAENEEWKKEFYEKLMLSLICPYAQNRISSKLFWGEQDLHFIQKVILHFMLYA